MAWTMLGILVVVAGADADFFEPVRPPRTVQVVVHRGEAGAAPENSRRALERCVEDYFEWAEVDVRRSKDGVHVLFHDETVDEKSDGHGPVAGKTLEELKRLDAGSWFAGAFRGEKVLTLAEALELARGRLNLYLDVKEADGEALAEEIVGARMEAQVVVFGGEELLGRVREKSGGRVRVMAKWRPGDGDPAGFAARLGLAAVEVDADELTKEVAAAFHGAGVKVEAKCLGEADEEEGWRRAMEAGADWIQTDRPVEVLMQAARGRWADWPVGIAYHRGAGRYAPENTVAAIEKAAAMGADYIEMDVRTTKDGAFLLLHDSDLERTTDGAGPIAGKTAEEVRRLDAGGWFGRPYVGARVPTFAEGLEAMGGVECVCGCEGHRRGEAGGDVEG